MDRRREGGLKVAVRLLGPKRGLKATPTNATNAPDIIDNITVIDISIRISILKLCHGFELNFSTKKRFIKSDF